MENEKELPKYNTKSWFKSLLLGFFIGIGVIVPGVSGAQISIIFKLYDKLTYAIGNILKKFVTCIIFLLPILIGLLIGFVAGFFGVEQLLQLSTISLVCLFAGLMLGGTKSIIDEIKDSKLTIKRLSLLIIGLVIPVSISAVFVNVSSLNLASQISDPDWWFYIALFFIAVLVGFTQIIPGLSATSLLMSFGIYGELINSVSFTYWSNSPIVFVLYLILVIGFLVGIISISKLVSYLLSKFKIGFYYFVLGLSISSVVGMFYNPEIVSEYLIFDISTTKSLVEVIIGPILFIVGFVLILSIIHFSNKSAKTVDDSNHNIWQNHSK